MLKKFIKVDVKANNNKVWEVELQGSTVLTRNGREVLN